LFAGYLRRERHLLAFSYVDNQEINGFRLPAIPLAAMFVFYGNQVAAYCERMCYNSQTRIPVFVGWPLVFGTSDTKLVLIKSRNNVFANVVSYYFPSKNIF
jgi:hypothetical protein